MLTSIMSCAYLSPIVPIILVTYFKLFSVPDTVVNNCWWDGQYLNFMTSMRYRGWLILLLMEITPPNHYQILQISYLVVFRFVHIHIVKIWFGDGKLYCLSTLNPKPDLLQAEPEFRPPMSEVVQDLIQMIRREASNIGWCFSRNSFGWKVNGSQSYYSNTIYSCTNRDDNGTVIPDCKTVPL